MTRSIHTFFWAGVSLLLAISPTIADQPRKPKTFAVVVGVGTYREAAIAPRPVAESDAKALFDLVIDQRYFGGPADVRLLLSVEDAKRKSTAATRETIAKSLARVAEQAGKEDRVIIGIFGRGAAIGERVGIFTADSTVANRANDSLTTADIEQALKSLKSEHVVALLDIDFKGVDFGKESALEPNAADLAQALIGGEDDEEHALPPGRVVILANSHISRHLDDGHNGIFARAIIDGLQGKADVEGYEPDGTITVGELRKLIETTIPQQAIKLGKTPEEQEQSPFFWSTRSSNFALSRNPAVAPTNDDRVAKLQKLDLPKEVLAEGMQLIQRMPTLQGPQDLRKLFVALADGKTTISEFNASRTKVVEGMKLDAEDADAFARRTLAGLDIVRRWYLKELTLGELSGFAVKGMYRALEESLPDALKTRISEVKSMRRGELIELLMEARQRLGRREDLEKNKGVDLAMRTAMFNLDAHSIYIDEDQIAQVQSRLTGQFTGIGVNVRRDMIRDGLVVISPIKDSPAHKAGVQAGDLITEIIRPAAANGDPIHPPEVTSTKGMKSSDAVRKIMGLPGTKVRIKVAREGTKEPLEFELDRARIDVETVMGVSRRADDSWQFMIDSDRKIAYVRITEFAPRTFEDLEDALKSLNEQKIRGLILDLRFNPGGVLHGAVQIADLFIESGLIVTVKPRAGVEEELPYSARPSSIRAKKYTNFPMVCLVNGESASASEIVSACLQDQQRAIVIGERSFGKGSVQTLIDFPLTNAKIKLTTATFWRPNGQNLHKASTEGKENDDWGVRPDEGHAIPLVRAEREALFDQLRENEIIRPPGAKPKETKTIVKDRQLEAALDLLRKQIKA